LKTAFNDDAVVQLLADYLFERSFLMNRKKKLKFELEKLLQFFVNQMDTERVDDHLSSGGVLKAIESRDSAV
jgi:hypothetical protein